MKEGSFKNYRFEDLEIWKRGMEIVHEVYRLTKKFPKTETFALCDQLQRAATSIVLNIAEGSGQPTKKLRSLYLQRSKSSALECVACIKIALQENFVTEDDTKAVSDLLQGEYFKIIAFNKSFARHL